MLEIGKLYVCKEYFLFIYPDADAISAIEQLLIDRVVIAGSLSQTYGRAHTSAFAGNLSICLNRQVSFCEPGTVFLAINQERDCIEILAEDKKGWISNREQELKEISNV